MAPAMRGMRNPLNSWSKADTIADIFAETGAHVGPNDLELAKRLALAGSVHAKYRRMIAVYIDISAPLYWWKEFDTYKVGTVANSCSTMHTIASKEFTPDDFSHEHLFTRTDREFVSITINGDTAYYSADYLVTIICQALNYYRHLYLTTKDKKYWWQMIQLLPSSYNQLRTVMLNYEVLARIYKDRKEHKLDEWRTFCNWIEKLPYAREMIFPKKEES
jgi:hypothetical protein